MVRVGEERVTNEDAGLVLEALVLGEDELGDVDCTVPSECLLQVEARL